MNWLFVGVVALLGFGLNMIFTPLVLKLAHYKDWMDKPNHRTVHKDPVPRLGGVGMFASAALTLVVLVALNLLGMPLLPGNSWTLSALLLFLGWASTHVLGVLDDFVQFRAVYKFLLQMLGVLLALGGGLLIDRVYVPGTQWVLTLGVFAPFVTLFWIAGVTNAVNLVDGMDGLAGGFSILALTALGVYSALTGQVLATLVCFVVVGTLLSFLVFNFPPAKIFMGDSGSLMLGYLLAVIPLWGGENSLFHQFWLLPVVLVLFPLSDTLAAILRRLNANRPIWSPDKEHTHHKLLALGFSTKSILAMVYGTTVITCVPICLAGVIWNHPESRYVSWVGSALAGAVILVLFVILHSSYRKRFPVVRLSEKP